MPVVCLHLEELCRALHAILLPSTNGRPACEPVAAGFDLCQTGVVSSDDDLPTWSSIADWYDQLLLTGSGPHQTALACLDNLMPDVADLSIIDIACGQGIVSRHLASKGARVTASDFSDAMIANAIGHGTPDGHPIDFRVDNAETLSTCNDASFDGATCQLGLMDIADLDATLAAISRILRPRGWLVFVIAHPAFLAPDSERVTLSDGRPAAAITDYFDERFWRSTNPEGVRRAGNFHRTMSTYLNSLHAAGFVIEEAAEPAANELLAQQQPLYTRVPIFFAARARLAEEC